MQCISLSYLSLSLFYLVTTIGFISYVILYIIAYTICHIQNTITTQCAYKDAAAIAMRQPLSLRLPISDLAKTAYEVPSLLQPTAMAGADINISDGYFCP